MSPHQRVSIAVGSGVKSRRTRSGRRAARGSGIVVRCRRPRWRGDFVGVRRSACRPAQHVILIPGRIGDAACAALVLNGSWKRSPLRKPHWAGFFHHRPRHLPALSPHVSGVDKSQRSALTPSQGRYAMAVSGCGLRWWLAVLSPRSRCHRQALHAGHLWMVVVTCYRAADPSHGGVSRGTHHGRSAVRLAKVARLPVVGAVAPRRAVTRRRPGSFRGLAPYRVGPGAADSLCVPGGVPWR